MKRYLKTQLLALWSPIYSDSLAHILFITHHTRVVAPVFLKDRQDMLGLLNIRLQRQFDTDYFTLIGMANGLAN